MAQTTYQQVPRVSASSPDLAKFLAQRQPVVITGSGLVDHISKTWTLDYLQKNLPDPATNRSKYVFDSKVVANKMTFPEFRKAFEDPSNPSSAPKCYLQTELTEHVGPTILQDFQKCNFQFLQGISRNCGGGKLTTNVLFIGQKGVITPLHYDEKYNLFAQLHGPKRFILYGPQDFQNLYPYPRFHSADRQSQVNLYSPDLTKYPLFANAIGYEAVLQETEVLYLPEYYWHHVESSSQQTISLSFWFEPTVSIRTALEQKPLKNPILLVILRRSVEEFLGEKHGFPASAQFFQTLDLKKPLTPAQQKMKQQLVEFVELFLEKKEVESFITGLVANRFQLTFQ